MRFICVIVIYGTYCIYSIRRYMYYGKINLNQGNMMSCWYAAIHHGITGLNKRCRHFSAEVIGPNNVCTLFQHATLFNCPSMMKPCFTYMTEHWKVVVACEDFLLLPKHSLFVLLDTVLLLHEKEVALAAMYWSTDKSCTDRRDVVLFLRRRRRQLERILATLWY